ncbi:MAG TPA: SDR family oxidoreductase [Chitinophagaceae bacterium]
MNHKIKTVLVTGANGFLGHYLVKKLLNRNFNVVATGKGECRLDFPEEKQFLYLSMDFTDPFAVYDVFRKIKPGIVIHAGAMSKPDECELNQWQAFITNTEGTVTLLNNADDYKSFFIFISTDFVFSGSNGPYKEDDLPAPVNYYGQTKLQAEEAVMEYAHEWAIVRTVLVYGKPLAGKQNILTLVQSKLLKGESVNIVDDQWRTPTFVEDLAEAIVNIAVKKATGTWHISGNETLTPYAMACMTAKYLHLDEKLILRTSAADFPETAKRPPRTGFIITKAMGKLNFSPTPFSEGLQKTFADD